MPNVGGQAGCFTYQDDSNKGLALLYCTLAKDKSRVDALKLPAGIQRLSSASSYFLSNGMLVEALTAAASLVGLCQQDELMSTVHKEECGFPDDWIFSIKDVVSTAVKVLLCAPLLALWMSGFAFVVTACWTRSQSCFWSDGAPACL